MRGVDERMLVRGARSRGGRGRGGRRGRCRGRNGGEKEDKIDGTKDGNGKVDSSPANVNCKRCAVTMDAKRFDAPDRCVALTAEKVIRLKYMPTSSLPLPAKLTRVAATVMGV